MAEDERKATLRSLSGEALRQALPDLARLRVAVFREYPYLYDGDLDYERKYLASYAASPDAVVVVAEADGAVVGAATGAPMIGEKGAWTEPLRRYAVPIEEIFYCGESVLLPGYRGLGLGHAFFDRREEAARRLGCRMSCFCAVIRPEDHPARPADYRPLDGFWRKRGYEPVPGAVAEFDWREIGETQETTHQLQYWARMV